VGAGLVAVGLLNPKKEAYNDDVDPYIFKMEIPKMLSLMGYRNINAFVPGIKDVVDGGYRLPDGTTALSFQEKRERGLLAHKALADFQKAKSEGRDADAADFETIIKENYSYFGYGFLENEEQLIPNVPLTFYMFHLMVMIGGFFILFFAVVWYFHARKKLESSKVLQYIGLWSIPLAYLAGQFGWVVAEVGRQPWTIQDVLPVQAAVSGVAAGNVITTFILFAVLFTVLLIAEVTIMLKQIRKGPDF
jgi:cytochrome d ubiquinol oxidase subunit I